MSAMFSPNVRSGSAARTFGRLTSNSLMANTISTTLPLMPGRMVLKAAAARLAWRQAPVRRGHGPIAEPPWSKFKRTAGFTIRMLSWTIMGRRRADCVTSFTAASSAVSTRGSYPRMDCIRIRPATWRLPPANVTKRVTSGSTAVPIISSAPRPIVVTTILPATASLLAARLPC